jgi:AcrR family transcriptional regulator
MTAAAELTGELGWGRVTTRAVAERAGTPHGAVSYHFPSKQELLVDAALNAFAEALPAEAFGALHTMDDLLALIRAELEAPEGFDPVLSRLMLETMREAERDPYLRERMGVMMGEYRGLIGQVVEAELRRGALPDGIPADGLATLLAAVGDGLMMHALLDADLPVRAALEALELLLSSAGARRAP